MPAERDTRYFPALPTEEIDDWKDDVRAATAESGKNSGGSNPVDDALAEELEGFVPEDWAAKTHIEDHTELHQYIEIAGKIAVLRRYNIEWAETLAAQVEHKKKLNVSEDSRMLKGLFRVFESFGAGSRGPGDDNGSGAIAWLKSDLTPDDDD